VQAPAGGWIKDLIIDGDAIAAKVEWTPTAKEYLEKKEYRYLSPVVLVRKSDNKAVALHSAALTNTPAIDGMFPIVNSINLDEFEEGGTLNMDIIKKIAALLGLDENTPEEEVLQKLRNEYIVLKKKVDHWDETIAAQKSKLEEALARTAEQKAQTEALKVEASYRNKVQEGVGLEDALVRANKLKEQQKSRYEEFADTISLQEQALGALEKKGLGLLNELEEAKAAYEQHRSNKQWDRDDIIKAETRYYSIKSVTDALKPKLKDIEKLELKITEYDRQLEALEQKLDGLHAEKEKRLAELDNKKLLLEEKKREQEGHTAFLLAQHLRANEPCPVCGATEHPCPAVYSEGEEPYRRVVINVKKTLGDKKYTNNKQPGNFKKDFNNHNGVTNKNYKKPFNTSKSSYNKNYSSDYKKDYEKYKESKIKKDQSVETV
jgi:DNA repair exonuclease SbcCD ATPase subunit